MEKKFVNPLFFEDAASREHVIAEVDNMEEAFAEIRKFCDECEFYIHYTRFWIEESEVDGVQGWRITFDVGSWSEFFHLYFDTFEQAEKFRMTMK